MKLATLLVFAMLQQATPQQPARTIELTGFVLVNGFYNSARVNNSDVPQFADNDPVGLGAAGGSIRQTRLGVLLTEPKVLSGDFSGEIDVDFFGGQQPSSGGRTFPLLRLRRAVASVTWGNLIPRMEFLIGQEAPLVAQPNPRSLAAIGFPEFAGAGNLWLWIPQVRVGGEFGGTGALRVALQGAVLAPGTGAAQTAFTTQPDSAERSGRPSLQARLKVAWGPSDDQSEIGLGGHAGWFLGRDTLSGDTVLTSRALTADARIHVGVLEFLGEAFVGKGLAGLGGGAIGQNVGAGGVAVRTKGGWGQLNLRPSRQWMVGGGCGLDDPDDADVAANGRLKNFVCEGHFEWRPRGPLVFGFAYRRFTTTYQSGEFRADHINLAAGFRL
jgi:hypothetical protein